MKNWKDKSINNIREQWADTSKQDSEISKYLTKVSYKQTAIQKSSMIWLLTSVVSSLYPSSVACSPLPVKLYLKIFPMLETLASLLRPQSLDEFVGQGHLVWLDKPLFNFLKWGKVPSMILRGPPWTGKTSIAYIIYKKISADFFHLSGVTSKKEDLTKIITKAKANFKSNIPTIVFLDEIHRWNKAQQDTLLPYVEKGIIILIWATTENPSFTVNNALLSRSRVFVFKALTDQDIFEALKKNINKVYEIYKEISIDDEGLKVIANISNWDLRSAINILETVIIMKGSWEISHADIQASMEKNLYYDRNSEEHYNTISAVHKSLRDSDADAACYWIMRMLDAWEDPLYIIRRLIRFAAEDIWIVDPFALILANNVYDSVHKIWMPESDVIILELALYLARAPKSNSLYKASHLIRDDIKKYGSLWVPLHLRNAPTKFMKDIGYWKWYKYAHDYEDAKVDQQHFPDELKDRKYFE